MKSFALVAAIAAAGGVGGTAGAITALLMIAEPAGTPDCQAGAAPMARLELVFGTARRSAPAVSAGEWQAFLDEVVTPRFSDGLTVLPGKGQWRNGEGGLDRERSRILLVWYAPSAAASEGIEEIRDAYKARFDQESVMRVEDVSCVSF